MGIVLKQKPVKLIVSIIFKDKKFMEKALGRLTRKYGSFEPLNTTLPFDFTDYYEKEFGKPLERMLLCFKKPVLVEGIEKAKLFANNIEKRLSIGTKRTVNIDPGYVTEAKLVLLTTKDYSHRVHVGRGIFAETTLYFKNETFNPWPWTYPDYASDEMVDFFNTVRGVYMKDLKTGIQGRM